VSSAPAPAVRPPAGRPTYTPRMDRRSALVLLIVFGTGVFLAGLELMVTAVALPSILADLADSTGASAWLELRKASWIINGYLLVYIVTMPLAGRLADLWGARRLFIGALGVFIVGSTLAGAAQDLDQLIAARLIQAAGGGVLVPVGTAAASHLFGGAARPRALGVIGALTFLGMATGPVAGAAILGAVHADAVLGLTAGAAGAGNPLAALLGPAWRWVFYLNIPVGIVVLALAWAASPGWETPRRPGRVDALGALWFGLALVTGLVGLTLLGTREIAGSAVEPIAVTAALLALAALASVVTVVRGLRVQDPFLDPRLFRNVTFSSAALVSLLTGYGFATAIIGGAVFVDRVVYGGPDEQRLALGALAGATALGALASGFIVRVLSLRAVTLAGLGTSIVGLLAMASWDSTVSIGTVAVALGLFGFGFGLTVTPRSTAAVEAAGRRAFGVASAVVTVARMVGMAVGLAILTAYGSTTIDRLADEVYATPGAYLQFIPEALRDRPLRDPFVVQALEEWASREAAGILVGLFVVAAAVTGLAVVPSLAMGGRAGSRAGMLNRGPAPTDATHAIGAPGSSPAGGRDADGLEPPEPGLAI
jgi:MFS family permease